MSASALYGSRPIDSPDLVAALIEDEITAVTNPCAACGSYNIQFIYAYWDRPYIYRCFARCNDCVAIEEF